MQIEKAPHQRIAVINTIAARIAQQHIGCLRATLSDLCRLIAEMHAPFDRYGRPAIYCRQQLGEIAHQQHFHFVDGDRGVRASGLRTGVIGGFRAAVGAHTGRRVRREIVQCALQCTDTGGAHSAHENLRERQLKQRRIVDGEAGTRAHHAVNGLVRAVVRHEGIVDHNVVTAGCAQTQHIPVLDDGVIALGQQESAIFRRLTLIGGRHQRTEENPFA